MSPTNFSHRILTNSPSGHTVPLQISDNSQPRRPRSRIQSGFPRLRETRFRLEISSRWQLALTEINIISQHPAAQSGTSTPCFCTTSSPLSTGDIQSALRPLEKCTEKPGTRFENLPVLRQARPNVGKGRIILASAALQQVPFPALVIMSGKTSGWQ